MVDALITHSGVTRVVSPGAATEDVIPILFHFILFYLKTANLSYFLLNDEHVYV